MSTSCIICQSPSEFYFEKIYEPYLGWPFEGQWAVQYHKCSKCGFGFSKTHQDLEKING